MKLLNRRMHWIAGAAACLMTVPAMPADVLITLRDMRVEGEIISETDEEVEIRTDQYGLLRFKKTRLKDIIRDEQAQGGTNNSFNDPFGSGSTGGSFDSSGWNTGTGESVEIGAVTQPPAPEPVGERRTISPPQVPFAWDAVLFDIAEDIPVRVRPEPDSPDFIETTDQVRLRSGAVIESGDSHAVVVFKNGQDLLRVPPHSVVEILSSTADEVALQLNRGSLWISAADGISNRSVLVRAGNLFANTNGGIFRVADALDRGYQVAVVEGDVEVASLSAQMATTVEAGTMLLVAPNGAVTEPVAISRPILVEDADFEELPADWWFRNERLTSRVRSEDAFVSINDVRNYLRDVTSAMMRYAQDTGHVPSSEEGFSVLRQNRNDRPGWDGPYWSGPLPPLDSWGRPLRYITRESGANNRKVGIVYSMGEDNIDNQGDPSADVAEMVLYYQLDNFASN